MPSPIRKGDKLEHGGEVTGGSPWTEFMGSQLARKGDEAICDQHGLPDSKIIAKLQGHESMA
ncbi:MULTISPECIES: PAAR domain-containing protein [unclassified Caballeronia]|uniref:PAAR domain-containing protein n=1 Tax=unclassified Caballeronia TaxID=2646786 RepID=UPI0028561759|nr:MULTISPECIES: PAAR domain-containing protein [unclassified Caballeronia]MDR5750384.1 PAAR domain-containing protein [Caballeronia sp. LZ024]MDR5842583.1 PAAR domain-containing protein [Caballeronia sp. LZ031]